MTSTVTTQPGSDDRLAPNPQLTRAGWIDLTGDWEFAYDDGDVGQRDYWEATDHRLDRTITVPFPPESTLSGIGDTGFHPVIWYARTIELEPAAADGESVLLHFGAVDHSCRVYVNGSPAGEHVGGMTSFAVDVTHHLVDGPTQRIVLRVLDDPQDVAQPRGKQDWRTETHGIFYERTSGIWQPVWLERVPRVHVSHLAWTTDLVRSEVVADLELSVAPPPGTSVRIRLSHGEEQLAASQVMINDRQVRVVLDLAVLGMPMDRGRLLWSPEHPTLVDAEVELITDKSTDRVQSYLGLRSVGFRDGRFLLNGHPYYLRMVLEQGYWPESHLASPSPDALRREVELIKELGFNGARLHQKVEDPRFLYWCDVLGLAVWGEMANAFVWSQRSATLLAAEWPEVIQRDRSHPCILAWIPLNESWGVPGIADDEAQQHFASAMYHLTKALDPTRPTVSNEGWEYTESDLWGVHDYTPSGDSIRARYGDDQLTRTLTDRGPGRRRVLLGDPVNVGQPIMITEFGGLSYAPASGQRWFGYSTIGSEEEYLERFGSLVTAIAEQPGLAGFCYTQLTDTLQEANGLLRADRTPKLPIEAIREIVTTPAASIPAEEIDAYRRAAQRRSATPTT